MNNFDELIPSKEILRALKILEYDKPLEVQEKVIPLILEGRDVVVKSQTGSGKTAAFGIPLCQLATVEERDPQALILSPTRELSLQIREELSAIGKFRKIRIAAVYGRHPMELQQRELRQRVHIISGTPGRILDHLEKGNIVTEKIRFLVIDEADEMLNMGFIDQVEAIIEKLPQDRQTLLFSATMPERVESICQQFMKEPTRVEITSKTSVLEKIRQVHYKVSEGEKFQLLTRLIQAETPGSSIIFVNTREKADEVGELLKPLRLSYGVLHGGLTQRERLKTIQGFKKGEIHFLIATDVAARGIHVEDITHVINYDFPLELENYIHRMGRTGRVLSCGIAISFVTHREEVRLKHLEEYLNLEIPSAKPPSVPRKSATGPTQVRTRKLQPKSDKASGISEEVLRLRINIGKKKKLRPSDVLGALLNLKDLGADDIGIIDVQETCTYVEIFHPTSHPALRHLKELSIKGRVSSVKLIHKKKY